MEETRGNYDSIQQLMDSMPRELEVKTCRRDVLPYYMLQSKNNDELQRHLRDPSIPITRIPTGITLEDFSLMLSRLYIGCYLVQIWAPVSIGDKKYLTTSDQPFAMEFLDRGLCSYRKQCLNYLIPINNDMSSSDPPGRVFRNGVPEVCFDISHYTSIEYPLRDKALNSGIHSYLALPFSKSSEYRYGSVVELVVLSRYVPRLYLIKSVLDLNREKFTVGGPVPTDLNICIELSAICKAHNLLLAHTWLSASQYNDGALRTPSSYISKVRTPWRYELLCFRDASDYVKRGRGVVGKAFSSKGACFCKDITQLSIDEYSMLPNARRANLTGCFAISLTHRHQWRDYIFIVEFFLPHMETENGDPRTLIKNLVATMKEHLQDFRVASGQELGENLVVEVIKTSPTDKLDSFQIGGGVDNTLVLSGETQAALDDEIGANVFLHASNLNQHGGEVMHLVDGRSHAENVNNSEENNARMQQSIYRMEEILFVEDPMDNVQNLNVHGADEQNVVMRLEQQDTNSNNSKNQRGVKRINREYGITLADLQQHSGKKLEEVFGCETQVVSDHDKGDNVFPGASNLNQHGGEVVDIVDARTEADQRDINSEILKNERAKKQIQRDYGITRAELLQHSGKKQEDAAAHFGVSRSTFKRICREHQISRWPPRRGKQHDGPSNGAQGLVHSENEIMKDSFVEQLPRPVQPVEQGLNSKPDSTRNSMEVENDSNIVVKVRYTDSIIKFCLSVSSGKMALEEEIAKRLRLSIGSFDIKYLDEDEDWISVTCDADLNMCISTMGSLGKSTMKMLVNLSQDS